MDVLGYVVQGLLTGLVYALLAAGIVLVYKGTRTINFAHPYVGLVTAFVAWWLTDRASFLPFEAGTRPRFGVAAVLSLLVAGALGWLLEHGLIRRLRHAPRLVLLVATLAAAQGLLGLVLLLFERNAEATEFRALPQVVRSTSWSVGQFVVNGGYLQVLVVVPAVVLGAALFFRLSRFGVAIRAAAENGDAAQLLGIPVRRVSRFTWIAGAVLAGLAGLLITSLRGSLDVQTLSTGFLVRALAAALVGGLTSLPGAIVGGLVIGVSEAVLQAWSLTNRPGAPETLLFALVLAVLLLRPGGLFGQRERTTDDAAFVPVLRDLPARLRATAVARNVSSFWTVASIAFVLAVVGQVGAATTGTLTNVVVTAMVGVSLTVLMGFTGQISLGHWALTGAGSFFAANLFTELHVPFLVTLPLTVLFGMVLSLVIGLPALRIRGLYLAIVTLAFHLACELFLFKTRVVAGSTAGIELRPPELGPFDLDDPSGRPLFAFGLVLLLGTLWVARNLASSRTGRAFFALRENEKAAATLGVRLTRYKLLSFAVSGGIAALAGLLFAMNQGNVDGASFPINRSLLLVAMVMIGGLGSLSGAIYGAFVVFGLPELLSSTAANPWIVSIGTGTLLIVVIQHAPGGIAGLVQHGRLALVRGLVGIAERPAPVGPTPANPGTG